MQIKLSLFGVCTFFNQKYKKRKLNNNDEIAIRFALPRDILHPKQIFKNDEIIFTKTKTKIPLQQFWQPGLQPSTSQE